MQSHAASSQVGRSAVPGSTPESTAQSGAKKAALGARPAETQKGSSNQKSQKNQKEQSGSKGSDGKRRGTVQGAEPVAARSFSGRAVLLVAVLVLVGIIVAPSVNNFLQQRAEISAIKADIAYQQQRETDLRRELSRWDDPAYIRMQARDRVNMVMPGETGYWVYGNAEVPAAPEQAPSTANPEGRPWADGLWQSIVCSATE
ncbi:FtsB family cell division protein [Acaricomes phytoseiuli]|uniref:FtsB family cell division protein n=1 Tax=Acaricomes phytoseiuli TaxID=291968 RepID=UPI001FE1D322|nr:septum formation initiator family protein [Acaricomes phytoseiuli]